MRQSCLIFRLSNSMLPAAGKFRFKVPSEAGGSQKPESKVNKSHDLITSRTFQFTK